MADNDKRIGELEDTLKLKDRRIEELRSEIDEQRDLIGRLREEAEEGNNVIDSWAEGFDMVQTESGGWTWEPFWDEHNKLIDDYNDLVRRWNKYLPLINGRQQPVGRPLAASEAQITNVLKLHARKMSLREIVDETSLGLRTVRTIISKKHGTDRTTKKHRDRLDISGVLTTWKRQKRTLAGLPRQAQRVFEEGKALITEAKGLGRQRL